MDRTSRMICPLMNSEPDPLIALITEVRKRFSEDDLFGGNCGMLAVALVEAAGDPTLRIGMAIREEGVTNAREIVSCETDIYHVWVQRGDTAFDGGGIMDMPKCLAWISDEYGDDQPNVIRDLDPTDKHLGILIRNDTDWSLSSGQFLATWKKPKRRRRP